MRVKQIVATGILLSCLLSALFAQEEFEVASIKENKTLEAGGTLQIMGGGGLRAQRMPARALITIAYGLHPFQLIDAPSWTSDTYYDVNARTAEAATREQVLKMLQALLEERFQFSAHRETRQVDGFALVRVRSDQLAPSLTRSAIDCSVPAAASDARCRQGGISAGRLSARGAPVWSLVQVIISEIGAPVSDETGLEGAYDVELRWSNELAPSDDRVTILTALQEQLGLRLDRRRVTTEVLVVERVERPTLD